MASLAPDDSHLVLLTRTADLPDLQARIQEPLMRHDLPIGLSVGRASGAPERARLVSVTDIPPLTACACTLRCPAPRTVQRSCNPGLQRRRPCGLVPADYPLPVADLQRKQSSAGTRPQDRPQAEPPLGLPHSHEIPPRKPTRHQQGIFRRRILGKLVGARRGAVALHGPRCALPGAPETEAAHGASGHPAQPPNQRSPPPPDPETMAGVSPWWRRVQAWAARFDPPWRDRVSRRVAVGSPAFSGTPSDCVGASGGSTRYQIPDTA